MFLGQADNTVKHLIEPSRLSFEGSGAVTTLGISFVAMVTGLVVLFLLIKRLGKPTGGINAETAILGFPVALGVLFLPVALLILMFGVDAPNHPFYAGLVQVLICLVGMCALFWNPYDPRIKVTESGVPIVPSWLKFKPIWLLYIPAIWILAYIAIQGAMFFSVALTHISGNEADLQPQIKEMLAHNDAEWIGGYYLLAAIGAPFREELSFRVVLFGGLTVFFNSLMPDKRQSDSQSASPLPMIVAGVLSVGLFVFAHGGWATGFLPLTVLGLILTGLYAYSGSIWPPIMFHAMHNGLVVTLQFFYLPQ
ncbi:MAG: CPBP family intramembrane glutamic endopeptidase [Planctomycetota bacterium]